MEIFSILAITILLICIILFFAVAALTKRQSPIPQNSPTPNKPAVLDSPKLAPSLEPVPEDVATSLILPDDPTAHFKENLQSNINRMISPAREPALDSLPLSYGDVQSEILAEALVHVKELKNFRSDHHRLHKILNDPALQLGSELSKMVTSDPVLAAKILNTVNAPYFGLSQKVNSIGHALLLIGIVHIREILYRNGLLQLFMTKDPVQNEMVNDLWRHLTLTSICAAHLQGLYSGLDRGTLFTMGLLHDIGKLILLRWSGADQYNPNFTLAEEDQRFGINHAVIGRMALESWGFSDLMVSTIEQHHMPSLIDQEKLAMDEQGKKYLVVLFLADQLAKLILQEDGVERIIPFRNSYGNMIDQPNLIRTITDGVLFTSIIKSEAFA